MGLFSCNDEASIRNRKYVNYIEGALLDLDDITAREQLDATEIKDTSLRKAYKNEQCFYEGVCKVLEIIEYEYQFPEDNGLSAAIKRMLFKSNGERNRVIKDIQTNKYLGTFYITNERVVLKCKNSKYSFDLTLDVLSNITTDYDHIIIESDEKTWFLLSEDSVYIRDLIELMNICYEEQQEDF